MYNEATRLKIPKEGFVGGGGGYPWRIVDTWGSANWEKRDGVEFICFIDKEEEANTYVTLRAGKQEKKKIKETGKSYSSICLF